MRCTVWDDIVQFLMCRRSGKQVVANETNGKQTGSQWRWQDRRWTRTTCSVIRRVVFVNHIFDWPIAVRQDANFNRSVLIDFLSLCCGFGRWPMCRTRSCRSRLSRCRFGRHARRRDSCWCGGRRDDNWTFNWKIIRNKKTYILISNLILDIHFKFDYIFPILF